jgi:hypothetical protein
MGKTESVGVFYFLTPLSLGRKLSVPSCFRVDIEIKAVFQIAFDSKWQIYQ